MSEQKVKPKYAVTINSLKGATTSYCNDFTEVQKAVNDGIPYFSFHVFVYWDELQGMQEQAELEVNRE